MGEHEATLKRQTNHPKSPSKSPKSDEPRSPATKRECACGNSMSCAGMSQAFRLLGDPRCHFVELPHYKPDPPTYKYMFRNSLRAAYIRHLAKLDKNIDMSKFEDIRKRRFVALHHFHPAVVQAFYDNPLTSAQKHKVPISITEHEMKELNMGLSDEDRILSAKGAPSGGYFFVPSYPHQNVHADLKILVRTKLQRDAKKQKAKKEKSIDRQFAVSNRHVVPPDVKYETTPPPVEARDDMKYERTPPPVEAPTTNYATDDSSTEDILNSKLEDPGDYDEVVGKIDELHFNELWDRSNQESTDADHVSNEEVKGIEINIKPTAENNKIDTEREKEHHKAPLETMLSEPHEYSERYLENFESVEDEHSKSSHALARPRLHGEVKAKDEFLRSVDSSEEDAQSGSPRKLATQNSDHPWDLSKYREVELETQTKRASAAFIDPTRDIADNKSSNNEKSQEGMERDDEHKIPQHTPSGISVIREDRSDSASKSELPDLSSSAVDSSKTDSYNYQNIYSREYVDALEDEDENKKSQNKYHASFSIQRTASHDSGETKSVTSVESDVSTSAMALNRELPGSDPTVRIQVHNDLIALESKRRSEMTLLLDSHREQWTAARAILRTGVENVEFVERLVSGFAKAGMLFADALTATSEDRFLNDRGKMVTSSFGQNRLMNRRSVQEYSIGGEKDDTRQSALLMSIIDCHLTTASSFDSNARHCLEEILPEVTDLKVDIQNGGRDIENLGDSIVEQLIRSEAEVKNLWDIFDALVTGDLMEYSVHGSVHGSMHGSPYGGNRLGGSMHSVNSGSLHGTFPFDISSNSSLALSPLKGGFNKQPCTFEDGWLIELIYKSAVSCQRTVFDFAIKELEKLYQEIISFEDLRLKKLYPLVLAFVPRQRLLFNALPDHMTSALDSLVGTRIDEDTLQTLIDEMIRDRSSDRLKKSQSHRSSIMNRSRVKAVTESTEAEVEKIEQVHGSPFDSSLILRSKVLELKPTGFGSIVGASWKLALAVVTRQGNLHVFELPTANTTSSLEQSPAEAFRSLYPAMNFDSQSDWVRKLEISRKLTPFKTLNLRYCKMSVLGVRASRNREVEVMEEQTRARNNFFGKSILKAVKDGGQRPAKCTVRLPSSMEANQWASMLQKTKSKLTKKKSRK